MEQAKRERLESKGWKFGDADEFLDEIMPKVTRPYSPGCICQNCLKAKAMEEENK